jgi:putative tryptophan/tyrosine transport system substrate-binding protein
MLTSRPSPAMFNVIMAVVILAALLVTSAQPRAAMPQIGLLEPGHPAVRSHLVEAFRQGLHELGYEQNRDISVEVYYAEGKLDRLPDLAAELVKRKVDIIVAATTPGILAAQKATGTIPIVMTTVGDPVATGMVASLARPGGNITGLTIVAPQLSAERLKLLKEAVPKISHVAVLWDSANAHEVIGFSEAEDAAQALGVRLLSLEVRSPDEFEGAFAAMTRQGVDGLFVFENATNTNYRKHIVALAAQMQLPAMYGLREYVEAGGLMSYGPSLLSNYRRAASFVDKILKGAKPAELPVEQPTTFDLVINLKTAQALGVAIPPTLLFRATEVIK